MPVAVLGVDGGAAENDWVEIEAGDGFSLGRKSDGSVYAWGSNLGGAFGLGRGPVVANPKPVLGL